MITDMGIIYTTQEGDIILSKWEELEQDHLMFSEKAEGYWANYGTYNEQGLFAFKENGENVECKQITWAGEIKDIIVVPDTKLAVGLDFSAFSKYVTYYGEGKVTVFKL